jgi:hypothetical protein
MAKRPSEIFLVIVISSLVCFLSAYVDYTKCSEIPLFSIGLNIQGNNQFTDQSHESDRFSSVLFLSKYPGADRLEQSQLLFPRPSSNQNISILRC